MANFQRKINGCKNKSQNKILDKVLFQSLAITFYCTMLNVIWHKYSVLFIFILSY